MDVYIFGCVYTIMNISCLFLIYNPVFYLTGEIYTISCIYSLVSTPANEYLVYIFP